MSLLGILVASIVVGVWDHPEESGPWTMRPESDVGFRYDFGRKGQRSNGPLLHRSREDILVFDSADDVDVIAFGELIWPHNHGSSSEFRTAFQMKSIWDFGRNGRSGQVSNLPRWENSYFDGWLEVKGPRRAVVLEPSAEMVRARPSRIRGALELIVVHDQQREPGSLCQHQGASRDARTKLGRISPATANIESILGFGGGSLVQPVLEPSQNGQGKGEKNDGPIGPSTPAYAFVLGLLAAGIGAFGLRRAPDLSLREELLWGGLCLIGGMSIVWSVVAANQ